MIPISAPHTALVAADKKDYGGLLVKGARRSYLKEIEGEIIGRYCCSRGWGFSVGLLGE